jgi:hypothetical protein
MGKYVIGRHLKGEGKRLALISELLDPMHRRHIELLDVVRPGARTLEVGCGNRSVSELLAKRGQSWREGSRFPELIPANPPRKVIATRREQKSELTAL